MVINFLLIEIWFLLGNMFFLDQNCHFHSRFLAFFMTIYTDDQLYVYFLYFYDVINVVAFQHFELSVQWYQLYQNTSRTSDARGKYVSPRFKNVASSEINYGKTGKKLRVERVKCYILQCIMCYVINILLLVLARLSLHSNTKKVLCQLDTQMLPSNQPRLNR